MSAREDNQTVVAVRDVKKYFGDFTAVNGVTFNIAGGVCFGICDRMVQARHPQSE